MQTMLRGAALIILLRGLTGSASAIDQSAIEETNCLMACDANQEHCMSAQPVSSPRISPRAGQAAVPEPRLSPRIRALRTVKLAEPVR